MEKKVVLVTGSSIGLGKATVIKFAKEGFNVVINYLTHEKEAYELKEEIENKYKVDVLVVKCNVSNENEIKNMYKKIIDYYGKLDVLVNNAGIAMDNEFESKKKKDFMKTLEVNLVGTFLVSKIFGSYMYENKKGVIINISSNNAIDGYNVYSLEYDASKAGIISLNHNLANQFAPYVRINTICPGWINTDSINNMNPLYLSREKSRILLDRFASPEEISNIIYFVASEEASYINDSIIKVDGGMKC